MNFDPSVINPTTLAQYAFFRARTMTFDDRLVTLVTLLDAYDLLLSGTVDEVTADELATLIVDGVARGTMYAASLPRDPRGRTLFDAPLRNMGSVTAKERTDDEMLALLSDPNLGHDVRNKFEAALALPLTVRGVAAPVVSYPFPLVFRPDGHCVPLTDYALVKQDGTGTTTLTWGGPGALPVARIVSGEGLELDVPPGVLIPPGGTITVPLKRPGKVTALGVLMRDGKVVRDVAPDAATAAQDRTIEQAVANGD